MSLRTRLALLIFIAAIFSFTLPAYFFWDGARRILTGEAASDAVSSANALKAAIEARFERLRESAALAASSLTARNAIRDFEEGAYFIDSSMKKAAEKIRDDYIAANPNPPEARSMLASGPDGTLYDRAHANHHPYFYRLAKMEGFSDLMLIEPAEGYVLYSTRKGDEFARPLFEKPLDDRPLVEVAREALKSRALTAFKADEDGASIYLAAPVMEGESVLGALAARVDTGALGSALRSGAGRRGGLWAAVTDAQGKTLAASADEGGFDAAFAGKLSDQEGGAVEIDGAGGKIWIASAAPLAVEGLDLVIAAGVKKEEALSPLSSLNRAIAAGSIAAMIAALLVYLVISRAVFGRLAAVAGGLRSMAHGGSSEAPPLPEGGNDEIGALASLLNDARRSVSDRELRLKSKIDSLMLHIENIENSPASNLDEAAGEKERLLKLRETEAERLMETVKRQMKEIDRLKAALSAKDEPAARVADEVGRNSSGQAAERKPRKNTPGREQETLPGF